jgi:hypothetical protein
MFTEMLSKERIEARKMGFDRPSPKFINFLNKYYGLNDYVPQNNNYVVFKDYFIDEPQKKDKYDIYNNNNNYSYNNSNNNSYNNSGSKNRNILSQRKLGKYNRETDNENYTYNNKRNEMSKKDKDFTTRIYREYNEYQKKDKNEDNNYRNKGSQKRSFAYNQYQSTSSEYGAFFHMNK